MQKRAISWIAKLLPFWTIRWEWHQWRTVWELVEIIRYIELTLSQR